MPKQNTFIVPNSFLFFKFLWVEGNQAAFFVHRIHHKKLVVLFKNLKSHNLLNIINNNQELHSKH